MEVGGKDKDTSVSSQALELSEREAGDKGPAQARGELTSAGVVQGAGACL